MKYETRVTRLTVAPVGEPMFSEQSTHVELMDEAAGEFVTVRQEGGHTDLDKMIAIDLDEWPAIRAAIEEMVGHCRRSPESPAVPSKTGA